MGQKGQYSAADVQDTAPPTQFAKTGQYSLTDVQTQQQSAADALRASGGLPKHSPGAGTSHAVPGLPAPGSEPMPKALEYAIEATPMLAGVGEAGAVLGGAKAIGSGVAAGARAALPAAGATLEQTAANVTKWAVEKGIQGGGLAGAWYLLHKLLGGKPDE